MFKSPGAIAFSFFSFDIHWYGIIMAVSILCGLLVIETIRKKYYKDISQDNILDLSFFLIIFGIISARAYYVLLDYKYFLNHTFLIPCIWNGGIAIHGAIIGGIITFLIYAKINNINFLKYADLFSFGLVTGQIIGRWGNFFNSEAFGLPCNLPWKLYIPYLSRPLEYQNYEYFHPAFLYESLLNIIVLTILLVILRYKDKNKNGIIFFSYLILYSLVRFITETVRIDSVLNISNLHVAHIASIVLFIAGIIGLTVINTRTISKLE